VIGYFRLSVRPSPLSRRFLPQPVPQSTPARCSIRISIPLQIRRSASALRPVRQFQHGRHRDGYRPTPLRREQQHHGRGPHRHRRRSGPLRRGLDHPSHQRARGSQRGGSPRALRRLRRHQEPAHEPRPPDRIRQGMFGPWPPHADVFR